MATLRVATAGKGGVVGRGARKAHLAFLVLVGLAGFAAIAKLLPAGIEWPSPAACALFLIVVAGARALAFPLVEGEAEISLDSAIFIAAIPCLGARPTTLGVAAVMSIAALARGLKDRRSP